jgi:hypothetical protein
MFRSTILLSLAALALGAAACGDLGQMQPQTASNATKATGASTPSATDLNTSSAQTPEWGMPALRPGPEGH